MLLRTPPNSGSIANLPKPSVSVPEKTWVEYFARQFSDPKKSIEEFIEKQLDLVLSNKTKSFLFVLPSAVHSLIPKLNKKPSFGVDSISSRHLQLAGSLIEEHLALLFQRILVRGVVPLQFYIWQITPILKKGKRPFSVWFLSPHYRLLYCFQDSLNLFW